MALYRVTRTSVAIVEAPDNGRARKARLRNEWEITEAVEVHSVEDVPEDWQDAPAIDTAGRDLPGTVRELLDKKGAGR